MCPDELPRLGVDLICEKLKGIVCNLLHYFTGESGWKKLFFSRLKRPQQKSPTQNEQGFLGAFRLIRFGLSMISDDHSHGHPTG
jgi:hypothetical protein